MAFVKGYTHDVFISYAHADDKPVTGADRGWVTAFAADLRTALSQRLSGDADIWMDLHELRGNVPLTPAIMQALGSTAAFVVVTSPRYLASEWCTREREGFLRLVKERARHGARMFRVELDPLEGRKGPAEFDDLIAYRFWVKEWPKPFPRKLGWPLPDPRRDQDYYDQITSLSYELAEELARINDAAAPGGQSPAAPKATVYLAEVTDDLEKRREKIKNYLKQAGLAVLPETWRTYDDLAAYQRAVDEDLARSRLFVQLLSGVTGKCPFGQPHGYPRLQHDRAALAGKPTLKWRSETPDDTAEVEDDQRALLEGDTVRAEGFEEFMGAVVKAATASDDAPSPPRPKGKFVFVSADTTDRSRAQAVICNTLERKGISYALPMPKGDPEVARKYLELSLTTCDAALVVYCESDIYTVFNQTLQCHKVIAQRDHPLPRIAIFDAPPPDDKDPLPFSIDNVTYLDCRLDPTALDKFLDSL
jgi:hypothetical protein